MAHTTKQPSVAHKNRTWLSAEEATEGLISALCTKTQPHEITSSERLVGQTPEPHNRWPSSGLESVLYARNTVYICMRYAARMCTELPLSLRQWVTVDPEGDVVRVLSWNWLAEVPR
jgi:hypothetical protein